MNKPSWVIEAETQYTGPLDQSMETNPIRGGRFSQVLKNSDLQGGPINVLLVGVGYETLRNNCPFEPYRIAGGLEAIDQDYQMTIVEINPDILEDVRNRRRIYLSSLDFVKYEKHWRDYLTDTNQEDCLIHEDIPEIKVHDVVRRVGGLSALLADGFHVADIPSSFQRKIKSGDISFIESDIVTAEIKGEFDVASCVNVLYLLPKSGQKIALYNISQRLKSGGILIVNDIIKSFMPTPNPLLEENGGWLDEEKLSELGLSFGDTIHKHGKTKAITLRKN